MKVITTKRNLLYITECRQNIEGFLLEVFHATQSKAEGYDFLFVYLKLATVIVRKLINANYIHLIDNIIKN